MRQKHWYELYYTPEIDKVLQKLCKKQKTADSWEDLRQESLLFMLENDKVPESCEEAKFMIISVAKLKLSKNDLFRKHENCTPFPEDLISLKVEETSDSLYIKVLEHFFFKGLDVDEAEKQINLLLGYDVIEENAYKRQKLRKKLIAEIKSAI